MPIPLAGSVYYTTIGLLYPVVCKKFYTRKVYIYEPDPPMLFENGNTVISCSNKAYQLVASAHSRNLPSSMTFGLVSELSIVIIHPLCIKMGESLRYASCLTFL